MPKHFRSKHFHFTWILAVLIAAGVIYKIEQRYKTEIIDIPIIGHQINSSPSENIPTNILRGTSTAPTLGIKTSTALLLKVPFTPQAPTANWDQLHNEACEEASMIMANAYYLGMKDITLKPEYVEQEIAKLTDWEKNAFGYYLDIDAEETAKVLREVYGLQTSVVRGYTEELIKKELGQNHLVLLPANGRLLGNPNFRQPGPPYHMLVLRGYNGDTFITNDPGTRKGLNYPYAFETLYNAGGDWSHTINAVDEGNKTIIVVWK